MKRRCIASGGPIGHDLTVAVEVGVHVPCPGQQASRMGPPRVERWPVRRHPGRSHRPGHLPCSLLAVARQQATGTSRPKSAAPAVATRIGALRDVAGTTPTSRVVDQTLEGSVRSAGICLRTDRAGPPQLSSHWSRARADQFARDHCLWRQLPLTRRCHPRRDGAEPGAGIGGPQPASTRRRPAVVSCDDHRIRLDPARGGERRYPPLRIATQAMGGDPAGRDHRGPASVRGALAAGVPALGGSPLGEWSW